MLEEALDKATRTLDKSKKAGEVQALIKENEGLGQKLRFQVRPSPINDRMVTSPCDTYYIVLKKIILLILTSPKRFREK